MKLTPITNPVALRLDTTFGTRIFSGTTMIYGDTGWRALVEWDSGGGIITGSVPAGMVGKFTPSGVAGGLYLRRIMNQVYGYFVGDTITDPGTFYFWTPAPYRITTVATVPRSVASRTPAPTDQNVVSFIGDNTFLLGLRGGMSAGGDTYQTSGTQWNYLINRTWPDASSTFTPKNTTILP